MSMAKQMTDSTLTRTRKVSFIVVAFVFRFANSYHSNPFKVIPTF